MSISIVGSGGIAGGNNTVAEFIAPANVLADDLFVMACIANPTTYDFPAPTGWTAGPVISISSTARAKVFWRWADGAEDATAQGWTSGQWVTTSRKGIAWACVRGVDKTAWNGLADADRFGTGSTSSSATTSCPAVSQAGTANLLSLWNERTSTVTTSTTLVPPASHTLTTSITWTSGGGICQGAVAWLLSDDTDGSVGSGSWGHAASGGVSVVTVRLPVASGAGNQPPTVSLSASATSLAAGERSTVTATASDSDGTVVTVDWQATAGAVEWGGSVAQVTNTPRTSTGTATVICTVTDDLGATTTAQVSIGLSPARWRLKGSGLYPPRGKRNSVVTYDNLRTKFIVWGHRGWSAAYPEEVLAGYRSTPESIATGSHPDDVPALEMDVGYLATTDPVTGQKYLVLNHDDDTVRTWVGGTTTAITSMTKAQWDVGVVNSPSAWPDEPAAYLAQILDTFGGRMLVCPEPKTTTAGTYLIAEIARRGLQASVLLQSSTDSVLDSAVAQGIPACKIYFSGFPSSAQLDALAARGISAIVALSSECNATTVGLVHSKMVAGKIMRVYPYNNVTTAARVALMRSYGCDGVISDDLPQSASVGYRAPAARYSWEPAAGLAPSPTLAPSLTLAPSGG